MSRLKAPFSTTELTYRDHDHVLQVLVDLPLFSRRLGLDDVGVGARQAVGGSPDFLLFLLRQKEKKVLSEPSSSGETLGNRSDGPEFISSP